MALARPIASIGKVNLTTGKNAMFDSMWNCWQENPKDSNMLVDFNGIAKIIHTAGGPDPDGDVAEYCADQSGRRYGQGTTIASRPHTKQGLLELAKIVNDRYLVRSLVMATYK